VQAEIIAAQLTSRYRDLVFEILPIRTKGDRMQNISLVEIGGKGVFVKEIEDALLSGKIDMAVHSMKDVPVELADEFEIAAVPAREDPRDVLISRRKLKLEEFPSGGRIGTGSLRRRMQLLNFMPDIEVVPIRGNIGTRIKKIDTEKLDGVILAAAGIRRMNLVNEISQFIPAEILLPAAGQGVLGVEIRKDDETVRNMITFLNHRQTLYEISAERAFLAYLGGGCQVPIAGFAQVTGDEMTLRGMVGSADGRVIIAESARGDIKSWEQLGKQVAERILSRGGKELLDIEYGNC